MNYHSNWYLGPRRIEYYFWFRSRLHFHAAQRFIPWAATPSSSAPTCCAPPRLGPRLSGRGLRARRPPQLRRGQGRRRLRPRAGHPRRRRPATLKAFLKRARWNQGFPPGPPQGRLAAAPAAGQRLLARYTLAMPFLQAFIGLLVPLSLAATVLLENARMLAALVSFVPLTRPWWCWWWRLWASESSPVTMASGCGYGTICGLCWQRRYITCCWPLRQSEPSPGAAWQPGLRGRTVAGPGDLVAGDHLEAHLGRPPLLVVEPGDHRVGGRVVPHVEQPAGAPGAHPVVLPDGAGRGPARPRTSRGRSATAARRGGPPASAPSSSDTHTSANRSRPSRCASSSISSPTGRSPVPHVPMIARRRLCCGDVHHRVGRRPRPPRPRPRLGRRGPRRRDPGRAGARRRRRRGRRRRRRPGRPLRRHAGVRHRRAARRARRRARTG